MSTLKITTNGVFVPHSMWLVVGNGEFGTPVSNRSQIQYDYSQIPGVMTLTGLDNWDEWKSSFLGLVDQANNNATESPKITFETS